MEIVLLTLSGGLGPGALTTDPLYSRIASSTDQQQLSRADLRLGRARFDKPILWLHQLPAIAVRCQNTGHGLAVHSCLKTNVSARNAQEEGFFVLLLLCSFDASRTLETQRSESQIDVCDWFEGFALQAHGRILQTYAIIGSGSVNLACQRPVRACVVHAMG